MVLNLLIIRTGDLYVAQCVELNLAVQATTLDALMHEFTRVFIGTHQECQRLGKDIFKMVPAAPQHFHEMLAEG